MRHRNNMNLCSQGYRLTCLGIILMLCFHSPAYGQTTTNKILFDHYGPAQGFKSAQALSIVKAGNGFVWIGTEQGLVRYDGHNFKTYRSDPFNPETISSNYIRYITEDKHGRLWLATTPTLNVFDPKNEKAGLIRYMNPDQNEVDIEAFAFKYEVDKDMMWVTTNHGLMYTHGKKIQLNREYISALPVDNTFRTIQIDANGVFWLAGTHGLYRYDPFTCDVKIFHRPGENPDIPDDDGFMSSYLDESGILWVGNWDYGIMRFDTKTFEKQNYFFADPTKMQNGVLSINKALTAGEENLIWLGTTDGVKTFNKQNHTFNRYSTNDLHDLFGVQGAGFCFQPTESEGLWIGTYNGLHRYDPNKQNIRELTIPFSNSVKDWLISDIIFEPSSVHDSIIWFSIPYNGIFRYDLIHNRFVDIPDKLKKFCTPGINPYTLFVDSENVLWLSTIEHGIVCYNLDLKKLIIPEIKTDNKEKPRILEIIEDEKGNIWLGSLSGLYTYDKEENLIIPVPEIKNYLLKNKKSLYSFILTSDPNGKLWMVTVSDNKANDIVFSYEPVTKKIIAHPQNDFKPLKILSVIQGIHCFADDQLMITSFNGFCMMKITGDSASFTLYDSYNDKPLGVFSDIVTDNSGNIWMSSDVGVTRFDLITNTITNYTNYNSSIGRTHRPDLSFSKKTNTLYIGQDRSINMIDLNKIKFAKPETLILSDLKILNYEVPSIPESEETIELSYQQNTFHFEFSNLSFTNSMENKYKYILGDENDNWTNMDNNMLNFNNLGYGKYVLKVEAENSFGLKSQNQFLLYIHIHPPFWRTWWFNTLIICAASFVIYSIFRYRDIQRQKLEKLRHSIARDLHDDMGSTLSHIRILSEREAMRSKNITPYKNISDKTAEVMNNMSEIIWSINPKNDSFKNIVRKLQEFAIDSLEPLNINVRFDIDDIPDSIKLSPEDRRHFYLIFKEAINNAAKYSKATETKFTVKIVGKNLQTEFIDNGVGFDPLLITRGNGLKNMENRAGQLGGKINITTGTNGTAVSLIFKK
ncbi:MAG: hypothetical protein H7X99_00100 [Saprospiraceae bacterium]|nr:hypothetical protein [Saprospiraceae bacterium]